MEQYTVTGMSCAACSARVEKAVSGVQGVTSCSVSLLTNSMGVEGTASAEEIIAAVRDAGYEASLKNGKKFMTPKVLMPLGSIFLYLGNDNIHNLIGRNIRKFMRN